MCVSVCGWVGEYVRVCVSVCVCVCVCENPACKNSGVLPAGDQVAASSCELSPQA